MDRAIHLNTKNTENVYEKGMEFFDAVLSSDTGKFMKLRISFEEAFVNILDGNPDKSTDIDITIKVENNYVDILFRDNGKPFDPTKKEDPDITLGVEERPIGGLGIYIIKKYADRISYRYHNGCNVFTFGACTDENKG